MLPSLPGSVCFGQCPKKNQPPGCADPDTGDIIIDPENFAERFDDLAPIETQANIIVVIMYHEFLHWSGAASASNNAACNEVVVQFLTAQIHKLIISQFCGANPGSSVMNECGFYNDIAGCYNNGCVTNGAEAVWGDNNCDADYPGGFPGAIPPCPTCATGVCPF